MPLAHHTSALAQPQGKDHSVFADDQTQGLGGGLVQALSLALPLGLNARNGLSIFLLLAAVAWFWHPLTVLYAMTQVQEHYSHILLVPFISLYAFYQERRAINTSKEWSPWLGLPLIGLGAWGYWSADAAVLAADHLSVIMLAFVVVVWGIFLSCFGIRLCRQVWFGLLFLLFMAPLPSVLLDAIVDFLQRSSAEATNLLFSALGVPIFREGFVFSLSNLTIQVAEECSGIRSALALFITALVAGHFFLRSSWARMGLLVVVIPLAIVKNAFRIVGLALLANYVDPTFITDSALHRSGGIPLFLISLGVLFFLIWLLRRSERKLGYFPPD
ncbi:exosortase/archaeosortase family protein [Petrachloros mirabilis]